MSDRVNFTIFVFQDQNIGMRSLFKLGFLLEYHIAHIDIAGEQLTTRLLWFTLCETVSLFWKKKQAVLYKSLSCAPIISNERYFGGFAMGFFAYACHACVFRRVTRWQ